MYTPLPVYCPECWAEVGIKDCPCKHPNPELSDLIEQVLRRRDFVLAHGDSGRAAGLAEAAGILRARMSYERL